MQTHKSVLEKYENRTYELQRFIPLMKIFQPYLLPKGYLTIF